MSKPRAARTTATLRIKSTSSDVAFATLVVFATGRSQRERGAFRLETELQAHRYAEAPCAVPLRRLPTTAGTCVALSAQARPVRKQVESMRTSLIQPGDLVFTRDDLFNDDGGVPDAEPGALLVPAGTRGMVVKIGHAEAQPETAIYLVQFEGTDKELGPPLGCLADELTQESPAPGSTASVASPAPTAP